RLEADAIARARGLVHLQRHLARHPADGQITDEDQPAPRALHAAALEDDLRMARRIEEVGGAQVLVALAVAGLDAGHLDARLGRRARRVGVVERERPGEAREAAAHLRDHHVTHAEADARARGIDRPFGHASLNHESNRGAKAIPARGGPAACAGYLKTIYRYLKMIGGRDARPGPGSARAARLRPARRRDPLRRAARGRLRRGGARPVAR